MKFVKQYRVLPKDFENEHRLLAFKHFGFAEVGLAVISFQFLSLYIIAFFAASASFLWTADAAQDIANYSEFIQLRRALSMSPPSWAGGAYAARGHSATHGASGGP